jgi:hypothetical protein
MITLATLPQATAQQVYDQVKVHLLKQGKKSENRLTIGGALNCAYRGRNATTCAAGCLIADDEYSTNKMEGYTWHHLVSTGVAPYEHERLIIDLQVTHDKLPVKDWPSGLQLVAKDHNLIP